MTSSEENDRLILVALQMIQNSIVHLPLQIAANLTTARGTPVAVNPQQSASGLAAAMKQAALGTAYNPIQLPPPPPPPPSTAVKIGSAASSAASFVTNNRATRAASAGGEAVIGGIISKFGAILGPMQLLNQVVSSQASGFQVLGTATRLFASTLAPIILPVVTVFAATLVAASDVLWKQLLPNLDKFNKFVFSQLIPAGEGLVGLFGKLSSAVTWIVNKIPGGSGDSGSKPGEDPGGPLSAFSHLNNGIDKLLDGKFLGGLKDITKAGAATISPFDPLGIVNKLGRWSGAFADNPASGGVLKTGGEHKGKSGLDAGGMGSAMRETLKELRMSVGPKSQTMGLSSVYGAALSASMNMTPFQQKELERLTEIINTLERGFGGMAPKPAPVYGEID